MAAHLRFQPGFGITPVERMLSIGTIRGTGTVHLFDEAQEFRGVIEGRLAPYADQQIAARELREFQSTDAEAERAAMFGYPLDTWKREDLAPNLACRRGLTASFQACIEVAVIPRVHAGDEILGRIGEQLEAAGGWVEAEQPEGRGLLLSGRYIDSEPFEGD